MALESKELVSYCGLYCGTCAVYKGQFVEAAKQLQNLCQAYGVAGWAPQMTDYAPAMAGYEQFAGVLEWFTAFDCKSCREGDGDPNCKMRICVKERGLDGCWACADLPCDLRRAFNADDPVGACVRIREIGPAAWAAEQ
ncbi:MAG: DUF3795 domain-containing protein [Chloroflexi bacterium]|nr:DUF3795 domain-containing protein [Chloroflexota bacterium]MBU1749009.1 DUF3795 domain-containing protein [Chloroflexota bacterium]